MEKFLAFIHRNPVRVAAWISATVAIFVSAFAPDVPVEAAVTFVLTSLGLGEYAQRVENIKTENAYSMDPKDAE